MKILKISFFLIIILFAFVCIFSPTIGQTKIYLSSKDKEYFLSKIQNKDKNSIDIMLRFYKEKGQKKNQFYLSCYANNIGYEHNPKDTINSCPKNPLLAIQDKSQILDVIEYYLPTCMHKGTRFLTRQGKRLQY